MADDNKISFLLDLDIKAFQEQGASAKELIKEIGQESNLAGLIGAIDSMLPLIGSAALAFEGFKKAIDFTLEGEEIERINKQFEDLAKASGISASDLKEGLEKASMGLVDTEELLKATNGAMLTFGESAKRVPELMTLAAKASEVYGGTAEQNFKNISEALNQGNVRLLKHYGIIVDATKAERDFAAQKGVTIDALSEMGKKQALFNAALDAGNKAFANITVDTTSAKNSLEILSTTVKDLGDIFVTVFNNTLGPAVRGMLSGFQSVVSYVKTNVAATFGSETEKAAAKLQLANDKLADMQKNLTELEAKKGTWKDFAPGDTQSRIQALNVGIEKQKALVQELSQANEVAMQKEDESSAKRTANIQKRSQEDLIDKEKREKQEAAFNAALQKSNAELFKQQQLNIDNLDQLETFSIQQRTQLEEQFAAKKKSITTSNALTQSQQTKLLEVEERIHQQQIQSMENDTAKFRQKLLQQYVANSKTAFSGIGNAFVANSQKMKLEQADFGKRGEEMWNSLSSNATSAFENMGAEMAKGKDIGQATADALKGMFLGMLGDRAIAEGQLLLLSSIWPPNPLGITAGAGLLALGGALKAIAGSSGGAPTTAAAGPSPQSIASGSAPKLEPVSSGAVSAQADAAAAINNTAPEAVANMEQQQRTQRTVSIHIAGNYLETDQTRQLLVNLIRQETDATGFNYSQIGA